MAQEERGRAYRRAQVARAIARAYRYLRIQSLRIDDGEPSPSDYLVRRYTVDRTPCSCWLCGQSKWAEPPLSEIRARISEKEQRRDTGE